MNAKVIGYDYQDFKGDNGDRVHFFNLYVEFENFAKDCVGNRCATVRSQLNCREFKQGDLVDLDYDVIPGSNIKPRLVGIKKVK